MNKILIVDDEPVQLRLTEEMASRAGYRTVTAAGGAEALEQLRSDPAIGAVVLDLIMPDIDGMGVLETMSREGLRQPVIVQTASTSLESVVSAMRAGAADYFIKPVEPERLTVSLRNALNYHALEASMRTERHARTGNVSFADIITGDPAMDRVFGLARKAAGSNIPVLIEGETGVGKELLARAIHGSGDRRGKPFIAVNCGAISPDLLESVLFGHVRGAFAGAVTDSPGKFREAHGGTLYLDEIGELPSDIQIRLLNAIQNSEVEPVGGKATRINVRLISATNQRLLNLTQAGIVREDLYYRLNVFPIYVPPLRDRPGDLPALIAHFVARFAAEAGRRIDGVSDQAMDLLESCTWPGNVGELENAIYRATVLANGSHLGPADFPQIVAQISGRDKAAKTARDAGQPDARPVHIDSAVAIHPRTGAAAAADRFLEADGQVASLADLERDLIAFAINHYNGHMSKVARHLGIGRSTLYRKLREYGLDGNVDSRAA